jgi:hypothetical protein
VTDVGWRIWAHPARQKWAEELQDSLDAFVPIVYDTNPVPSKDPQQRWAVCRRVLELAASDGAEYVGWLQDDAIVCRDYTAAVSKALDAAGSPILLSPYCGAGRPNQLNVRRALRHAEMEGTPWLSTTSLNWGVSVIFPTRLVEDVLREGSKSKFRYSPSDYRIGVVLRDYVRPKMRSWYLHPSLVQHRDEGSLVGHDKPGQARVAHAVIGADASGLDIDFTRLPGGDSTDGRLHVEPATHARQR